MQKIQFTMNAEKLGSLLLTLARRTRPSSTPANLKTAGVELSCCYLVMRGGNLSFFSSDGGVAIRFTVEKLGGDPFVRGVEFQYEAKLFEKMARPRKKKWADVEVSILSSGVSIRSLGEDFEMALFTFVDYPLSEPFWEEKFDGIGEGAPPASGWGALQKIKWSEISNFNLSVGKGTFAFREGESIFLLDRLKDPKYFEEESISYFNSTSFTELPALLGAFGNEGTLFDEAPPSIHPPTGKLDPLAFSCQGNDLDGFKIKWELLCNSRVKTKQDTAKSHLNLITIPEAKEGVESVCSDDHNEWWGNIRVEAFDSDSPHPEGFIVLFVEEMKDGAFYLVPKAWFDTDNGLQEATTDATTLAKAWGIEEVVLKCPAWMLNQPDSPRVPASTLEA